MPTSKRASTKHVKPVPKAPKAKSGSNGGHHTQKEDFPWEINIPDHEARTDSPAYVVARKVMNSIVKDLQEFYLGSGPYQDHHGGGLWVKDDDGWFLIKNLAGMEWSQQFCADPAKVDVLRRFAQRIYRAFPESLPAFKQLGFGDAQTVLDDPIDSQDKVSRWVDSIFNASVPLNQARHTGTIKLKGAAPQAAAKVEGGVHHYPTPITDIQLFKHDDFQLWVLDGEGQPAAVTPAGSRGSGDGRVRVAYATHGSRLHKQLTDAQKQRKELLLGENHPMAKQAFALQDTKAAKGPKAAKAVKR